MLANDVNFVFFLVNVFRWRYRGKSCNLWQRENEHFPLSVRACSAPLLSPFMAGEERQLYDTSNICVSQFDWNRRVCRMM